MAIGNDAGAQAEVALPVSVRARFSLCRCINREGSRPRERCARHASAAGADRKATTGMVLDTASVAWTINTRPEGGFGQCPSVSTVSRVTWITVVACGPACLFLVGSRTRARCSAGGVGNPERKAGHFGLQMKPDGWVSKSISPVLTESDRMQRGGHHES